MNHGKAPRPLTWSVLALALCACADHGPAPHLELSVVRQAVCEAPVPEKAVYTVAIPLPPGFATGDVTLAADDTLEIRDVDVPGTAVNMGQGDTVVYSGAAVGNIYSRGLVDLRDGATVLGMINTTTDEITQGTVNYDPSLVDTHFAFDPEREVRLNFPAPTNINSAPNVWVDPNITTQVNPGTYNRMDLRNNAQIILKPGLYWVDTLAMEPQATFTLDTTGCVDACSVVFNVAGSVTPPLRGFPTGMDPDFLLIYHGTSEVTINTEFSGFIIAVNAPLRFNSNQPHRGAFFARSIVIDAGQTIEHRAFVPSVFEVWEP